MGQLIVVESVFPAAAKDNESEEFGPFSQTHLNSFRARLKVLVEEYNNWLLRSEKPVQILNPRLERGKIIICPRDFQSGNFIIDLVNARTLTIEGHIIKAGWNLSKPTGG